MNASPIMYINFHNNTQYPVMVESWGDEYFSNNILVGPNKKIVLYSSVGEWHLNSMLNREDRKIWDETGLKHITCIGKFRSSPCASKNYAWLDYDIFKCEYSEINLSSNKL